MSRNAILLVSKNGGFLELLPLFSILYIIASYKCHFHFHSCDFLRNLLRHLPVVQGNRRECGFSPVCVVCTISTLLLLQMLHREIETFHEQRFCHQHMIPLLSSLELSLKHVHNG
jgi:hypothetical protein